MIDQLQAQTEALAVEAQRQVQAICTAWLAGQLAQAEAEAAIAGIINRANAAAVTLADVFVAAQIENLIGQAVSAAGVLPVDDSDRLADAAHTILSAPPPSKLSRQQVRDAIGAAGLDPDDWDVGAVTTAANATIRQSIIDMVAGEEHGPLAGVDFVELVAENAPSTALAERLWAELESGQFDGLPPVWEPEPEGVDMRLDRLARSEPFEASQRASIDAMRQQPLVEGWTRQMDSDPCQLCRWWWRNGRVWPKDHPFQSHKGCNCQPRVVLARGIQSTGFTRQLERNAS